MIVATDVVFALVCCRCLCIIPKPNAHDGIPNVAYIYKVPPPKLISKVRPRQRT